MCKQFANKHSVPTLPQTPPYLQSRSFEQRRTLVTKTQQAGALLLTMLPACLDACKDQSDSWPEDAVKGN